jgi:7-cyano-7-deazaguanine synthase
MGTTAIVLLSGGLDSATACAVASNEFQEIHAITFRYGQRHAVEVEAARRVAAALSVASHRIVDLDLRALGGSALTSDLAVPKGRSHADMAAEIPVTYVPARNTILLSYALGLAEVIGARHVYVGVNAIDYSGYPDCRPEYLDAFERLANLATKAGVEGGRFQIRAPLLKLSKADIIRLGLSLGVDYALTSSCYDPDPSGAACGGCDSCQLRLHGFEQNGIADPIRYAA